MGAHYQPVGQVHFLTNVLDFEMDVQLALDSPRTFFYDDSLSVRSRADSRRRSVLSYDSTSPVNCANDMIDVIPYNPPQIEFPRTGDGEGWMII